jgi:hypothetical protein
VSGCLSVSTPLLLAVIGCLDIIVDRGPPRHLVSRVRRVVQKRGPGWTTQKYTGFKVEKGACGERDLLREAWTNLSVVEVTVKVAGTRGTETGY